MSTSTSGEPAVQHDESYSPLLLKCLLRQMMLYFGAQGACIALHDENTSSMRIDAHIRFAYAIDAASRSRNSRAMVHQSDEDQMVQPGSPVITGPLAAISSQPSSRHIQAVQQLDDIEEVTSEQSDLFIPGTDYAKKEDVIGYAWYKCEVYMMSHDEYVKLFRPKPALPPLHLDVVPSNYLVVPVCESTLVEDVRGRRRPPDVLGIIVLYHLPPVSKTFQQRREEIRRYVEQIALYLQNDRLNRTHQRISDYLQRLQSISTAFPKSVMLSELVEEMYQFVVHTVDVSSMLLTLYDRDLDRLYDVFAIDNGERIASLVEQPTVRLKTERPVWWKVTQDQKLTLHFSPGHDLEQTRKYEELLTGIWGDQRNASSFLLLPLKMFNRVTGALCLASNRSHAFHPEEVQILETMLQIVTVSIENAKLYERDRSILYEAKQREAHLAAINSALQAIGSVLNVTELLNNLVESAAAVVKVDLCVFFEPSPTGEELVAHALYAPSSVKMVDDGSGLPVIAPPRRREPDAIINMIRLPFKGTFLEHMTEEGFFYLDAPKIEDLAHQSNEGGIIFFHETAIDHMLMIPLVYQMNFCGFLAVPTPPGSRSFRPRDVGTLLAICAQAASAIRSAQLFEQREEAYAELQRLDHLKDEFLVTASHELRTPLTAISGYASQLQRQSSRATPQQIHRFASKISVAAQQLTDLVSNITEAAQIGPIDKKMDLHLEPVEVHAAAEIAMNMLTHNVEHKIDLDIPRNLWLQGDAPSLRQVLTNLMENAVKYSPPGCPVTVCVETMMLSNVQPLISEDQVDHTVLIEQGDIPVVLVRVKDHGEGIQSEDQQKIFEKFVRAPRSLTTPVRGSGLGLYICRRFVNAMGGKLWLEESIANQGSIFSFYLPRVASPVDSVVE